MAFHRLLGWARHRRARAGLGAALVVLALAGCGGGGGGTGGTPSAGGGSGSATLGVAGGQVLADDGARVDLPADALAADTTIRIAQDSSGAPDLPAGLRAAGPMRALTPHGITFAQPATVRLPKPDVALAPNEKLMLAKAESASDSVWQILSDTTERDGMLQAQVSGFSFFLPVIVAYPVAVVDLRPVKVETIEVVDCGGQDCQDMVGPTTVKVRITVSGTQVPSYCADPSAGWVLMSGPHRVVGPLTGNSIELALSNTVAYGPYANPLWASARIRCNVGDRHDPDISSASVAVGKWRTPASPGLLALPLPDTLQVVDGRPATLDAILMGGAHNTGAHPGTSDLAPNDSATVFWERSDDRGGSWKTVAQSFQFEAERQPFGGSLQNVHWTYWRVRHGFVGQASDAGVWLRVRACYTPPTQTSTICATSNASTLVVAQASAFPVITTAPQSMLVRTGQTASFTAAASGTPAPTLQWQTRAANSQGAWADVAGATGTTYTTAVLGLADNGLQVRVVASNAVGQAEGAGVTVSVSDLDIAPTITTQPATIAVAAGGDAVFAVAARGTEALSYQWRFNGNPIAGANTPVLKLAAVTGAQAGRYSVVVGNAAGSATSADATLDVTAGAPAAQPPTIVTQPVSVRVNAGNTATLAVGVAGTGPFSYQWLRSGAPIAGATAAYYSVAAAALADDGSYAVQVSNAVGNVTSWNVIITVDASAAPQPVAITTQPSPQVQLPGGSATFAVAASGTGPFGYQWLKNGAPIAGANAAVLLLGNLQAADAASYSVTVTNALGGSTSQAASLTVVGAPAITSQPAAANVDQGKEASFSVAAAGQGLRYQWLRNGVGIAGADQASYTTPPAAAADSGAVYSVIVYNGAGLVFSQGATLTVAAAPPVNPALARGKLAAAYLHTCAITASNDVACWGHNSSGQIGTGNVQARATPYLWNLPEAAISVSAGANGSCAVTVTGAVWCSGSPLNSMVPTRVDGFVGARQVAVGQMHTCVLASDATVWCWGANGAGMLGNGNTAPSAVPVQVLAQDGSPLAGVLDIQAGLTHTCAVLDDYRTRCWGTNSSAQSGAAAGTETLRANVVDGAVYVDQLALGGRFSCAFIGEGGVVSCWGLALDGSGLVDPVAKGVFDDAPAGVGAGEAMACAITQAGRVHCWGTGMMGNGNVNETHATPTLVGGLTGVMAMAGGQGHSCVLRQDGSLACWGGNSSYQLGTGDGVARTTPAEVTIAGGFWRR